MCDYTTPIIAMIEVGVVLTAALGFALIRHSDMQPFD